MGVKIEELPWLYFVHGSSNTVVPYPYAMDKPEMHSPETWIMWARRTALNIEIPHIQQQLEQAKGRDEAKYQQEEVDFYEQLLVDANRELDMVKAKYAEFEDIIFDKL